QYYIASAMKPLIFSRIAVVIISAFIFTTLLFKTLETKTNRIARAVVALSGRMGYGEMMRMKN
ncbi:MAG: hypothetical protein ABIR03_14185, partial [Ginsengibacter sp.]